MPLSLISGPLLQFMTPQAIRAHIEPPTGSPMSAHVCICAHGLDALFSVIILLSVALNITATPACFCCLARGQPLYYTF